jgi:hypothetical protein
MARTVSARGHGASRLAVEFATVFDGQVSRFSDQTEAAHRDTAVFILRTLEIAAARQLLEP